MAGKTPLSPGLKALLRRRPPTLRSLAILGAFLIMFAGWTVVVIDSDLLSVLDAALAPPHVPVDSSIGQVAATVAMITWPMFLYLALLGTAIWAVRRRLRSLAVALVVAAVLGWAGEALLRFLLGRARPSYAADVITTTGYGYPSGHTTAAVTMVIMVAATFVVTRETTIVRRGWQIGGAIGVLAVALDRWLLAAHFPTDVIGGFLLGGLVSTMALVAADVHILPPHLVPVRRQRRRTSAELERARRCAVIFNPVKVYDWAGFRRNVDYELAKRGYTRTMWLETTEDDPGRVMTALAVKEGVDLVLGAGGDGTIRVVSSGLAHSGIPFGLIPSGTGNLLAKNLGIPLDGPAALAVALDGEDWRIDLVRLTVDDREPEYFAVMAGIGIDAVILGSTNPDLKKAVGSAAYFVSAAQNARHPAANATFTVDDGEPFTRRSTVMVVGNVGYLQAGIPLIPDAVPDDGLLDLLIASPRRARDWVRLTARVLTRERRTDDRLERFVARKVVIEVADPDEYQLDGDTVGAGSRLVAEIAPGALIVRRPRA